MDAGTSHDTMRPAHRMTPPAIHVAAIRKVYGRTVAMDDVSFDVERGEILAGRRYVPVGADVPIASFALALLVSTLSIVSIGFLIASVVPTARFAQPLGTLIVYPMLGLSGLFIPVESLSPTAKAIARMLPFTYAVSLLRGIWHGEGWSPHAADVACLMLIFLVCTAIAARVFRWE